MIDVEGKRLLDQVLDRKRYTGRGTDRKRLHRERHR
jgi:hypothetical protein